MRAVTPSMDVASSFGSYSSQELDQCLSKRGLELDPSKDNHVRWSPNSPHHPRHWRNTRKAYNVCFIGLYEAFEAGMTTVGASAAYQARRELGCSATVSYLVFTTLMLVGEGISGVVCPPLSESFGRKSQYVISCAFFCIFTGLSAIPSVAGIGISRFLAGLVGGVVPSISPGSIEDLVSPEHQGWAIFSWITASNIGLVMAPILSSYISEALGWHWIFYIGAIFAFAIFIFSLFYEESRPSLLLSHAHQEIQAETGITILKIENHDAVPNSKSLIPQTLTRPLRLLVTEPPILISSLLNALAFTLIYILTEALPLIYTAFGLSFATTSLAFIPILIGILLSVLLRLFSDAHLARRTRTNKPTTPETKLTSLFISAPLLLSGLWTFAWTIPPALTPSATSPLYLISMAALIPIGIAANDFDTVIASYIVDVYGSYSASAFASVTWTRAVMSVVFSLVTEELFGELGNNGAASLCAAGAVVVCVGVGALVRYGESFRERSTFAARFGGEGDGGGEAGGPARGHVTASSGLSGAC